MGPFDMKVAQGFMLGWKVSDKFSVGVFHESALFRGSHEYKDDTVSPNIKHKVVVEGDTDVVGIRLMTDLDLSILTLGVGLDLGTQTFNTTNITYPNSDGSMDADGTNFGVGAVDVDGLTTTAPVMGLTARWKVLEVETKTVTTSIDLAGSFRFVPLVDTYVFGTQETSTTASPLKKIDAVGSFNNVDVSVGVGIWF